MFCPPSFCVYVIRPTDGLWFFQKNLRICFSDMVLVRQFFHRLFFKFYKKLQRKMPGSSFFVHWDASFCNKQSNKHRSPWFCYKYQKWWGKRRCKCSWTRKGKPPLEALADADGEDVDFFYAGFFEEAGQGFHGGAGGVDVVYKEDAVKREGVVF